MFVKTKCSITYWKIKRFCLFKNVLLHLCTTSIFSIRSGTEAYKALINDNHKLKAELLKSYCPLFVHKDNNMVTRIENIEQKASARSARSTTKQLVLISKSRCTYASMCMSACVSACASAHAYGTITLHWPVASADASRRLLRRTRTSDNTQFAIRPRHSADRYTARVSSLRYQLAHSVCKSNRSKPSVGQCDKHMHDHVHMCLE